MTSEPTRSLVVAPERLARWLANFEQRHGGPLGWGLAPDRLIATATDGGRADCEVPFPPLRLEPTEPTDPADPAHPADPADPAEGLVRHALAERRAGVLLVRLGGYAAGVFRGSELVTSKVGSRLVHGRNAAGGQSQQRFARRREGQVRVALAEAADVAVRILGPAIGELDVVVTGGDRRAVAAVLHDSRLAWLRPLVSPRLLDVPDPRLRILLATPAQFQAVRITLTDPAPPG